MSRLLTKVVGEPLEMMVEDPWRMGDFRGWDRPRAVPGKLELEAQLHGLGKMLIFQRKWTDLLHYCLLKAAVILFESMSLNYTLIYYIFIYFLKSLRVCVWCFLSGFSLREEETLGRTADLSLSSQSKLLDPFTPN